MEELSFIVDIKGLKKISSVWMDDEKTYKDVSGRDNSSLNQKQKK